MDYRILLHEDVEKVDLPALSTDMKRRIKQAFEDRLLTHPDFYGKPLSGWLAGMRKLRVGDWRIIYRIVDDEVRILIIGHRSKVYRGVFRRLPA